MVDFPIRGVQVLIVTGPQAGTMRSANGADPLAIVSECVRRGWDWRVAYPPDAEAGDPDVFAWACADLAGRIFRALRDGRAVRFAGRRWQVRPGDRAGLKAAAVQVEAAIAARGRSARIMAGASQGDLLIGLAPPGGTRPVS